MTVRRAGLWWVGLAAAVLVAVASAWIASGHPDGLERVAEDHGFAESAEPHALESGPMADYQLRSVEDPGLSGGLAGIAGVAVTLAVGGGVLWLLRRRPPEGADSERQTQPAP